jgi:hypothetical protein
MHDYGYGVRKVRELDGFGHKRYRGGDFRVKKGLTGYLIGVILVLGIAAVAVFGPWVELGVIEACQNIYGYFPSFRCCDEIQDYQGSRTLSYTLFNYDSNQIYQCPSFLRRCEVRLTDTGTLSYTGTIYRGSDNCARAGPFAESWSCSDDTAIAKSQWYDIQPGEYVHIVGEGSIVIDYKHFRSILYDCGLAGCSTGSPVLGADGCGFNTNMNIYDQMGRIKITADAQAQYAYTVPYKSCYTYYPETNRHIIGDTCEECTDNQDCVDRYGSSYTYLGQEYGATCDGSHVQLYTCQETGSDICVKWREDSSGTNQECLEEGKQTRCDLYLAIPVQCCPGTSGCGPNAFCNPDTYVCEQTAECTADTDCGHTVQCDYADTTLNTPKCISGQCGFDERDVECCADINCPVGYYCAADYTCKEKSPVPQECPYECCENEQEFFDRPCALGEICCDDHTCQVSCDGEPPEGDLFWLIIPALAAILGVVGYFAKGAAGGLLLGVLGGVGGFVIWWFSQLGWLMQFLILIGLGGLGVVGLYLFGGIIVTVITAVVIAKVSR